MISNLLENCWICRLNFKVTNCDLEVTLIFEQLFYSLGSDDAEVDRRHVRRGLGRKLNCLADRQAGRHRPEGVAFGDDGASGIERSIMQAGSRPLSGILGVEDQRRQAQGPLRSGDGHLPVVAGEVGHGGVWIHGSSSGWPLVDAVCGR